MIIPFDSQNVFGSIQHPLLIIHLTSLRIDGNFLYLIKSTYEKITANIVLNVEMLEASLVKSVPLTIGSLQPFAEGPN